MVINTEFGAFGNSGLLNDFRTLYDLRVDVDSMNPGKQIYEKMISGMYIGEICRIACIDFAKQGVFFQGEVGEKFKTKYILETKYVSAMVHDNTPNLERIHYHLHYDLDIPHVSRYITYAPHPGLLDIKEPVLINRVSLTLSSPFAKGGDSLLGLKFSYN